MLGIGSPHSVGKPRIRDELREACRFDQTFFPVSSPPWPPKAQRLHAEWIELAKGSGIPELAAAGKALWDHRSYVFDAMHHGRSNTHAEGINNSIKVLVRLTYGYRRFDRLRTRALLVLGPTRIPQSHVSLPKAGG